jgi:glycosyltransferase involved in cell wall biosynthesis
VRILVFAPYFAPHVGGLEAYVAELDEALLAVGDVEAVTVVATRLPPHAPESEQLGAGHRVVRVPALELIPNFPVPAVWRPAFWRALADADRTRHDVVVGHTRFFLTSLFALAWARWRRRPLVHVEHGSDFVQLQSRLARWAARGYDYGPGRLLLRRADAVVSVSHAAADFVRQLSGRRSQVVYRGVDSRRTAEVRPSAEVRARAGNMPVVAFAGRLIDGKGVHDLLDAFAAGGDGALLCVVGDGPRRADLEAQAERLGIGRRTWFLGQRSGPESLAALRAADVVVNPSYTEGLPTSVLEAALLGRAVLATDVGGTREIVTDGESALLVPARDRAALAESLARLLSDSELRRRLGDAARARTLAVFDWEACAREFSEVARSVVRSRAR